MEPIGDLLNHAAPPTNQKLPRDTTSTAVANVFRFLNEGEARIQYHAEDDIKAGQELLYTYGALTPSDSLLWYGFTESISLYDDFKTTAENLELEEEQRSAAANQWFNKKVRASSKKIATAWKILQRKVQHSVAGNGDENNISGDNGDARAMETEESAAVARGKITTKITVAAVAHAYAGAIKRIDADIAALASCDSDDDNNTWESVTLDCLRDCRQVLETEQICLLSLLHPIDRQGDR